MANDSKNDGGYVLLSTEVELYVEALKTFPIEEIGSAKWTSQREMIEKLNMQAILSASSNETEYVKESLLTFEKMPLLVHELISIELWSEKVFKELVKINFEPKNTFVTYLILYHEAVLVNLIETVLYHQDICQSLSDSIYDLVDYCHRKFTKQIGIASTDSLKRDSDKKSIEANEISLNEHLKELVEQSKKIQFDISMKLFSILRYIIDNLTNLPFGVTDRILNKHDFILILVQMMDLKIWCKNDKEGKLFKYIDNKWKLVPLNERFQLTKIEGQIWISLYELLLNPNCVNKYEYSDYKKNQILKLRSQMNEVLIDQIPNLGALQRFLEQLAISEPPPYKSSLLIEQISEIFEDMIRKYKGKWKEIARDQSKSVLNPDDKTIQEQAKRWSEMYNTETVESLIEEPAKCAECGETAPKKCSRCQSEWYCRRECQVKHWPKHKKACDMIHEATSKLAKSSISKS